jgi:hypothetical protein
MKEESLLLLSDLQKLINQVVLIDYTIIILGGGKMRITQEKMDAIAVLMDDETREKVHRELAPCEPIEFLKRYCELEPSFETVLKNEFGIEI